ncbi:MAG: BamA/TamA family outer membrane protein [Bacteroidetes bacterium]|nr:BamA/TamA family outer membrane protein [Bacteroidota bacterium]
MRIPIYIALALVTSMCARAQEASTSSSPTAGRVDWNHFPIVMYDTDVGFGGGYKTVLRNALGSQESFDLTLFASTKGERWVRLGASWPDAELRQGSEYPFALDVVLDYDKMISNSFFGVGDHSRFDDREMYTFEPLEITAAVSRGFTPSLVAAATLRFKRIWSYGYEAGSSMPANPLNAGTCDITSAALQLRYDTRTSVLQPTAGMVLQADVEQALPVTDFAKEWTRLAGWAQYYTEMWDAVVAARFGMQALIGDDIPIQHLLPIGGNNTVRGIPKDRFLDRVSAVGNLEFRFPVYHRLGGVLGVDAGAVSHEFADIASSRWIVTPVAGLRYYLPTFVVRADVGWSNEAVGVYFNFGQIF